MRCHHFEKLCERYTIHLVAVIESEHVLMKVLQAMLIQTEGSKIFLLPAWPSDWNADFKVHAPAKTTIEG